MKMKEENLQELEDRKQKLFIGRGEMKNEQNKTQQPMR